MSEENGNQGPPPRRIVKKRGHGGGHHGGAWKVAYADFVTAMMALFIVLWLVGQDEDVKKAVAGYFTDPTAFKEGGLGVAPGGIGAAPAEPRPAEPDLARDLRALDAAGRSLRAGLQADPTLAPLLDRIEIRLDDEGLRIELVETGEGAFFDVGSATVKPATEQAVSLIAREVARLPNSIAVEGHTDSRPFVGAPHYSNWELSADRANAARRLLEEAGVPPARITQVVGYADRRLADARDPYDASNRRISVLVRTMPDLRPPVAVARPATHG